MLLASWPIPSRDCLTGRQLGSLKALIQNCHLIFELAYQLPLALADSSFASSSRVVDGALGAELLAAFKALVENPVRMLV